MLSAMFTGRQPLDLLDEKFFFCWYLVTSLFALGVMASTRRTREKTRQVSQVTHGLSITFISFCFSVILFHHGPSTIFEMYRRIYLQAISDTLHCKSTRLIQWLIGTNHLTEGGFRANLVSWWSIDFDADRYPRRLQQCWER